MARWQRDPQMRQKMAWLLVVVEVLALAASFALIFLAYLRFVVVRLSGGQASESLLLMLPRYVTLGATVLVAGAAVYQGVLFVRGCRWARTAFLVENGLLVLLGLMWFVKNRITGDALNTEAAFYGLLLPMLTLFPLLWPLLTFSPTPDNTSEGGGPA